MCECSAYRKNGGICANGFIQKHCCWMPSETMLPYCQYEELPEHWLNDDGSPRFYRPAPPSPSSMNH